MVQNMIENIIKIFKTEIKRTLNPHEYYVDGTSDYANFKQEMIMKIKKDVRRLRE